MKKVLLILCDGMRPDSLAACGHPFVNEMLEHSIYTLKAQTVMPSVTLPCHVSLFLSVTPERHGILTNTYVPQVRPVRGICEVLRAAGKACALFYDWDELKDLARPGSLWYSNYVGGHAHGYEWSNKVLEENALSFLKSNDIDFTFLYKGWPDEAGHGHGWMGAEYIRSVHGCFESIQKIINSLSDDYLVILTADHGGHDRSHGTDKPEDMTIPIIFYNKQFTSKDLGDATIMDIAPTITSVLGVEADRDWEGHVLEI